jgi:hypothetical protein
LPTQWKTDVDECQWDLFQVQLDHYLVLNQCQHYHHNYHASIEQQQNSLNNQTQSIINSLVQAAHDAIGKTSGKRRIYRPSDNWFSKPEVQQAFEQYKASRQKYWSTRDINDKQQYKKNTFDDNIQLILNHISILLLYQ